MPMDSGHFKLKVHVKRSEDIGVVSSEALALSKPPFDFIGSVGCRAKFQNYLNTQLGSGQTTTDLELCFKVVRHEFRCLT